MKGGVIYPLPLLKEGREGLFDPIIFERIGA
jgi:hypothetical protein